MALCLAALAVPAVAVAAFPGSDPSESPRLNTPDDPDFDRCESDDPDTATGDCSTYFEEQYGSFGFSPESANSVPLLPHSAAATPYVDCDQLDAQGKAVNNALGDPECAQISGVRADTAWKYSKGSPDVVVAILDTGIRWQDRELTNKVHLNAEELPTPKQAGGADCAKDDCNDDGAFDVRDFADDPRVAIDAGDTESDGFRDPSDLIATFSDGSDADGNGFVDDIAGWDFFDDDNDPFDASSCCSANGHGTGRAKEAVAETDNGSNGTGLCPDCQLLPLRIWDTFVTPTDFYASAALYATRNGASVIEGAVGGLTNTRFARHVFEYAGKRGVALMLVSSDINSANHNYPTNYNEAIYVAGSFPDTAPNEACSGPGGLPLIGDVIPDPPDEFADGCDQLLGLLSDNLGISPSVGQPITTSFFRNSNLTQYGGKADIVLMGATGSENTGQSAGAAGLLASFGRETFGAGEPLSGNEIRQLLTMTAEDVLPLNTGTIGQPDKANAGWDPHFGYGRVNLAAAMKRIADDRVPPEAQIDAPDWFSPIDVDRLPASGLDVRGHAGAPHSTAGVGNWELEYACGQDALDADFQPVPGASGSGPVDGVIGTLSRALLADLAANCDGSVADDPGRPAGLATDPWPADPYPEPDPERHAFQIRFTVHEDGDAANFGRYRKTLFAYEDDGNLEGWPKPIGSGSDPQGMTTGSGGETSTRLYDLDGDNRLEVIMATSSGELWALRSDGTPLPAFHGGEPILTRPYALADNHGGGGWGAAGGKPRESLRIPAIGDIDGDREPEIVASAGEHVYAWEADGEPVAGFPVNVDRSLSEPCKRGAPSPCFDAADRVITTDNHIKRGIFGSVALADLDGDDRLDIVSGAMDQHVYAWDGDGESLPGFPAKVASAGADGAEIVTSPAIAQLDGEGPPEIVIATNEVIPGDPALPTTPFDIFSAALGSATGSNPIYALHGDGTPVAGWPAKVGVAAGDLLPMVLPGHDAAVHDADGDGDDEVTVSAGTSLAAGGGVKLVDGDAATIRSYQSATADSVDQGPILNLADYPSIGDLTGLGPAVVKGGLTLNGAANLLAVNQNLPFSHVVQAWDPLTGLPITGFPRASDDFQLVSQPSIARVGGSGPGHQALYGTGLYQLHAYGAGGLEPAGWPKFTGGWTQATATIGDADGDGDLEVSALTREGWSFLWETTAPACADTNSEWWTFHHDEFGSANYGTDARPPGAPRELSAGGKRDGTVELRWKAPGDDWLCGEASRFEVRVSGDPIEHPGDGRKLSRPATTAAPGDAERFTLSSRQASNARYAAVLYRDDAGNWGRLASAELPVPAADCEAKINGSRSADRLDGGPRAETINGGAGADTIHGHGGDDCLNGGRGRDRVFGEAGEDAIRGGAGDDRLAGERGDDTIRGNAGSDRIDGAKGADTLRGGAGRDRVEAGPGADTINVLGGGPDRVDCGKGKDTVKAGRRDEVAGNCETVKVR